MMREENTPDCDGIVITVTGKWCEVLALKNNKKFDAILRGKLRQENLQSTHPVAVGDWVSFEDTLDQNIKVITKIKERKNCILRRSPRKVEKAHILAANIDQSALIVTLKFPKTPLVFIDRFLAASESYDIPALIIFNKIDLHSQEEAKKLTDLIMLYHKLGYTCLSLSLKESYNIQALRSLLSRKITLLSGLSGVGKSTFINHLVPEAQAAVREISAYHNAGKHTTSFSRAYLWENGLFIDTPGIKEFKLFETKKENVSHYFREMLNLGQKCKYRDCLHTEEEHCYVKEAVSKNYIAKSRYTSYINILKYDFMRTSTNL